MREINNGEAPSSGGAKSFAERDETGGAQANRGAPAGHKKAADDDLGELLKKHKKRSLLGSHRKLGGWTRRI